MGSTETKQAWGYERIDSKMLGATFRVTHEATDSRVATCHDERSAKLVCAALNAYDPKGEKYPGQ